ncbi:mannosyltransferase [Dulcicalothrix desertica PCC 7102]|uniref:Mannosyltransferase n=1 Tax=Dulcicalothrix desertica PCC 7102 TaxID=232991 RepID=A0A433V2E7_9CYAN|nr:glycosyltransferase family 1 protein [Dulcicalothrix desertica]RUT00249.1 mannosyltransferase [Dulcicalothrix desertica PCC 7102]TWH55716.1 glycosyltransferase involved in cell wall biosynthesis [Dulcicalothrix desertica PCC 7102]
MRVVIARTMQEFSMDVYADGIISGLKSARPNWEIIDLAPRHFDRRSHSLSLRVNKYYERFWTFPRLVKQQKADIFHVIDPSEAHVVYWLNKKAQPAVVTCHDLVNFYYKDNLQGSVQLPFISKAAWIHAVKGMRHAKHIVSVSSITAKDTTKLLDIPQEKITVTPNAVDPSFQQLSKLETASLRQKYNIPENIFCLLNVGSNHPRKNLSTILKAISHLINDKNLPVYFLKAGSDFTEEQKKYISEHQLTSNVSYLGKPDKQSLVELYNTVDILMAPSLHEGFGITVLEAMACGTPVITSNTSALPEVAGDAGVLVNPLDSEALASAVYELYSNNNHYQILVEKGIARAKLFTWEKTGELLATVYEDILSKQITPNINQTYSIYRS